MAVTAGLAIGASSASAEKVYALDDGGTNLYSFDSSSPGTLSGATAISGLAGGDVVLGIDIRPTTGDLVALAKNTGTNAGTLYTLNKTTAAATPITTPTITGMPALTGTDYDIDFNPSANALRIVGDNEQNLRVPFASGVVATDSALTNAQNATPNVVGAAYTNSLGTAASTALYDIDSSNDTLVLQNPPNGGVLQNVGALGQDTSGKVGFDISGTSGAALASLRVGGVAGLYGINLSSGAAALVGTIGDGTPLIADIAIDPGTGESEKLFGLNGAGGLVTFSSNDPTTVTTVAAAITGLGAGESVVGIDIQPATGRLFAVTVDAADNGRVYTVNKATGAATIVTTTPFALGAAAKFGVDFNPVPNAIRIVSSDELSLRVSPATGNLLGTDTALAPAGNVVAAAYTNNVNGANSTTLYDIDSGSDSLVRQGGLGGFPSPNGGALTTIGALGASFGEDVGFDISGATNIAYATVQTTADLSSLHRIDLATGRATAGQAVGRASTALLTPTATTDIVDIAVDAQPPSVQFSGATFSAGEKAAKATVTITRTGNTDGASTVSYATSATGNATAGSDFTAIAATPVTFAAGETSKTFDVVIADDAVVEDPETIGVALSAPTGASLGAPNAATINVFDNDPVAVAVPGPVVTVPGPSVPAPTPADTKKPVIFVLIPSSGTYGSLAKSGLRVDYSSNEKVTIAFTLKLGSTTIGTGRKTLNDAAFSAQRIKLTSKGKSTLSKRVPTGRKNAKKRATLTLTTVATDAAGNKTTVTKRIVVRR